MGASLGSSEQGSRNVELNIVPFIDLMSCLTAFLLVTAVWVNISSLQNEGLGRGRDGGVPDEEPPRVAVLIEAEQITVSSFPTGESIKVVGHDWARLESALREFKTPRETPQLQIAADSTRAHPIPYSKLVSAMDTAVKVGYPRVGVVDAKQLMP
jgi:biopolymer transport protein TolR